VLRWHCLHSCTCGHCGTHGVKSAWQHLWGMTFKCNYWQYPWRGMRARKKFNFFLNPNPFFFASPPSLCWWCWCWCSCCRAPIALILCRDIMDTYWKQFLLRAAGFGLVEVENGLAPPRWPNPHQRLSLACRRHLAAIAGDDQLSLYFRLSHLACIWIDSSLVHSNLGVWRLRTDPAGLTKFTLKIDSATRETLLILLGTLNTLYTLEKATRHEFGPNHPCCTSF